MVEIFENVVGKLQAGKGILVAKRQKNKSERARKVGQQQLLPVERRFRV
jgi:hypothetical protein